MGSVARFVLDTNTIEPVLEDPPETFVTTQQVISNDYNFSEFDANKIFQYENDTREPRSTEDKYLQQRQFYISKLKAEKQKQQLKEKRDHFKDLLKGGDMNAISDLFKKRHEWKVASQMDRADSHPICEVEDCCNIATFGSKYCIPHIMKDKDQQLFIECPVCKRPYPKTNSCLYCRDE